MRQEQLLVYGSFLRGKDLSIEQPLLDQAIIHRYDAQVAAFRVNHHGRYPYRAEAAVLKLDATHEAIYRLD